MSKIKKNWLELIQTGKSREIAWKFFIGYTNPSKVSRELYSETQKKYVKASKKTSWSMPNVNTVCNLWKYEDFFDIKKKSNQHFSNYIFNLNPFFKFCKEKKNIIFTLEEKKILKYFFTNDIVRKRIYRYFSKDEDFINGLIKYYINFWILPYSGGFILYDNFDDKIEHFYMYKIRQNGKSEIELDNNTKEKLDKELYILNWKMTKTLGINFTNKKPQYIKKTINKNY